MSHALRIVSVAAAATFLSPIALAQSVKVDGSSTVFPVTEAVAEEFQKLATSRCVLKSDCNQNRLFNPRPWFTIQMLCNTFVDNCFLSCFGFCSQLIADQLTHIAIAISKQRSLQP